MEDYFPILVNNGGGCVVVQVSMGKRVPVCSEQNTGLGDKSQASSIMWPREQSASLW